MLGCTSLCSTACARDMLEADLSRGSLFFFLDVPFGTHLSNRIKSGILPPSAHSVYPSRAKRTMRKTKLQVRSKNRTLG